MQAVILLAGYGSRLNRDDLPHKCLLPFNEETLLSRHLSCLKVLGIDCAHLVVGHNKEAVKEYVHSLNPGLDYNFFDNDAYLTTGNTLSMVMGLRHCNGDVLILDGDVLYPRSAFTEYVKQSAPTSFALVSSDIDNIESAKVLIGSSGGIEAFITKRALTPEERSRFHFGGEAIGFFKLSSSDVKKFIALYENNESKYLTALWEIPFTDFAKDVNLLPWSIREPGCFEIDTQEDYEEALAYFFKNREKY